MGMTEEKLRAEVDVFISRDGDGVPEEQLVCFVCTGNTCRSPMAAAVLNHLGRGKYRAISAGVSACEGDGMTGSAIRALQRAGIESTGDNDYENHRARSVDRNTVLNCDRVVAMTAGHMMQLIMAYPEAADKICVMPHEIPDPFMYGDKVYDLCLERIIEGIREMFALDE